MKQIDMEDIEKMSKTYNIDVVGVRLCCESTFEYQAASKLFVKDPTDAAKIISDFIRDRDREVFGLMCLNAKGEAINMSIVSIGTLTTTQVNPREVFKVALLSNAAAIIAFHNHPSGDPTPSCEDVSLTRRIVSCGELLGVKVIDHIVVGGINGDFRSIMAVIEHEDNAYD